MAFGKNGLVNPKPITSSFSIYRTDNGQTLMSCDNKLKAEEHRKSLESKLGVELKLKEIRPI